MGAVWTAEQVIGLAPDGGSAKAGKDLANPRKWSGLGSGEGVLWGECQGSGALPYQTKIDLTEPAFACSCPSRKFPCKHALGLFLIWAGEPSLCPAAGPPAWVASWLESRAKRVEKNAEKAKVKAETPADPEAARKREAARLSKVAAGVDDLGLWLTDLVRHGLVSAQGKPSSFWEEPARRLVDAQAPGLARRLRQVEALPLSGDRWQDALLDRLGRLYLAVEGRKRLDTLPPETGADLRAVLGLPVDQEALRAGPGVRDVWQVVGQRVEAEDRLQTRRTWLIGRGTGRPALLLDFAHGTQAFETSLPPGSSVDADLAFFPGSSPLRALIQTRHGPPSPLESLNGHPNVEAGYAAYAGALAANPWLELYPMALAEIVLDGSEGSWRARDLSGGTLPVSDRFTEGWFVLAVSGGRPVGLAGEFDGVTLEPLSVVVDGRLHPIAPGEGGASAPGTAPIDAPAGLADLWREASACALVGVDRRPPPKLSPDDPLANVLQGLDGSEPPAQLLSLAGAASWYGRVGRKAATDPAPLPEPCPPEDLPECSPARAARLRRVLGSEFPEFLSEWLKLLAGTGARLPSDSLPEVLDRARRQSDLRDAVRSVLGSRGRWLAERNPYWAFVGGEADRADPAVVWETGTPAERRAALQAVRAADPARALALIASTWAADPADARVAALHGLRPGLGMDDELFLEAALDDRSKVVRLTAADLLMRIPESRLCARMAERAGRCVLWDARTLTVSLPEACDKAMVRDGVEPKPPKGVGERTWWLRQLVSSTPPGFWCRRADGATPARLLALARKGDWSDLHWTWLAEAATRVRDKEWVRALLDEPTVRPTPGDSTYGTMLDVLDEGERDGFVLGLLNSDDGPLRPEHPAYLLIVRSTGPFAAPLAREIVVRMKRLVEGESRAVAARGGTRSFGQTHYDYGLHTFLTNLAGRVPTGLLGEAETDLPEGDTSGLWFGSAYRKFLDGLRFRHEMRQEFDR